MARALFENKMEDFIKIIFILKIISNGNFFMLILVNINH